jgi:Asp-tRNA(Asn)/Glu-tRNA(Gln) amidotransferase B subunit
MVVKSVTSLVLSALASAVMKKSRGKFPPQKVNELNKQKLG